MRMQSESKTIYQNSQKSLLLQGNDMHLYIALQSVHRKMVYLHLFSSSSSNLCPPPLKSILLNSVNQFIFQYVLTDMGLNKAVS